MLTWDILLHGEFVVGTPPQATAVAEAAADPSVLERLLQSVAALAKASNGGVTPRRDPKRGAKYSRRNSGGKKDATGIVRRELEQQDYLWTFQLHLGHNGMSVEAARLWLADNVARAQAQNAHMVSKMQSTTFPQTDGSEEAMPTTPAAPSTSRPDGLYGSTESLAFDSVRVVEETAAGRVPVDVRVPSP